jgi:hypothetical protein
VTFFFSGGREDAYPGETRILVPSPMVDDPRDALECFGSTPVDVLAIGPFVVSRNGWRAA